MAAPVGLVGVCVAEWIWRSGFQASPARCVVFLDKEFYSTLSPPPSPRCIKINQWVLVTHTAGDNPAMD